MFRESDGCPKEREAPLLAYSDIVRDHFLNPRNVGALESPDGVGTVGDPVCGDFLKVTIRVEEDRIAEIRFSCRGCPAAIATASAMTELAAGKTLDEAWEITDEAIEAAVGGLPPEKRHCSNLGASALSEAVLDYLHRCIERETGLKRGA